jgi:hypothetical protein
VPVAVAAAVEVRHPTGLLEQEVDFRGHQTDYPQHLLVVVVAGQRDLWVLLPEEHHKTGVSVPEEQQREERRPEEHQKGSRYHTQAAPEVVVARTRRVAAHRSEVVVVAHTWAAVRRVLRKKVAAEAVLRKVAEALRRVAEALRRVVEGVQHTEHRIAGRRMAAAAVLRSHSSVVAVLRTWVPQTAGPSA